LQLTTGNYNTAVGPYAMQNSTTGSGNTAVGYAAQSGGITTGSNNTSIGNGAGNDLTTGSQNVFVGKDAGANNTTGEQNTAIGNECLRNSLTTGNRNTCMGSSSGQMYNGSESVFIGNYCGKDKDSGDNNTGVGNYALSSDQNGTTSGSNNVAVGDRAGKLISTGNQNVFVGKDAGDEVTTGSQNIAVGCNANPGAATNTSVTIGHDISSKGSNTAFIGGTSGAYNGANTTTWSQTSDIRIKKNIVENNKGLDLINAVQIKNFEYKTSDEIVKDSPELKDVVKTAVVNKEGTQLGVIAQELEEVLPEVVITNEEGIKSVNSENLTWYLINAVKELSARLDAAGL